MTRLIQRKTQVGEPVIVGERTITPQSQFVMVRFPFGGFVWNRPTAVLVTENGQTHTIPITDPTRLALWALTGVSVMISLLVWLSRRNRVIR
jgi:hypothetical protein